MIIKAGGLNQKLDKSDETGTKDHVQSLDINQKTRSKGLDEV